jgi:hypothetical protein
MRFGGDEVTSELLEFVALDEITHVAFGNKNGFDTWRRGPATVRRTSGQVVVGLIAIDFPLRDRRGRAELRGANIWDLVDGVAAANAAELLIGQFGAGFRRIGFFRRFTHETSPSVVAELLDLFGDDRREGVRDSAQGGTEDGGTAAKLIQFLFSKLTALPKVNSIGTEIRRAIQVDHGKVPLSRTCRICSSIHGPSD